MTKLGFATVPERLVGDAPDCGDREWDDFTSVMAGPEASLSGFGSAFTAMAFSMPRKSVTLILN